MIKLIFNRYIRLRYNFFFKSKLLFLFKKNMCDNKISTQILIYEIK